jgi:hypothetical protein
VFHTTADLPMGVLHIDPGKLAFWSRHDDKLRFRHHALIRVRGLPTAIEGDIVTECPAQWLNPPGPNPDGWRLIELNVTSRRAVPQSAPPGAGGSGPGQLGVGGMGQDQ